MIFIRLSLEIRLQLSFCIAVIWRTLLTVKFLRSEMRLTNTLVFKKNLTRDFQSVRCGNRISLSLFSERFKPFLLDGFESTPCFDYLFVSPVRVGHSIVMIPFYWLGMMTSLLDRSFSPSGLITRIKPLYTGVLVWRNHSRNIIVKYIAVVKWNFQQMSSLSFE